MKIINRSNGNLIKVRTTEINESAGFGPFRIVVEVESILAVLVLQHEVHALPFLILFAFFVQISLHPHTPRFLDTRLFATFAQRRVNLFGARVVAAPCNGAAHAAVRH